MKTTLIALSAATLIATAPAVLARHVSSKSPGSHHHVSRTHPRVISGYASWQATHTNGMRAGYPGAFGYAPSEPRDGALESSRQAGGGGGGGGSGM